MLLPLILLLQTAALAAETHVYRTVDGLPVKAEVHRPAQDGLRPVIFFIHGGALIGGSRLGVRQQHLQRYLEEGFVVVSVDYRLAPETRLPAIWSDVEAAYLWLRTEGGRLFHADSKRIAVVGHSAGGYLTLMAGAALKPRPKALVSWYGYGDLAADWYAKPDEFYRKQPLVDEKKAWASVGKEPVAEPPAKNERMSFYLFTRQQGLWPKLVTGFDPIADRARLDRYCPARLVTRDYPPALLLHGDEDTDVPLSQSLQMAGELKRKGARHEMVLMKGHGHGFDRAMDKPEVRAAFEKSVAWLKQWTK